MAIVISDTSPVQALANLELLHLLSRLFGEVIVPPAVVGELAAARDGCVAVDIRRWPFITVRQPVDRTMVEMLARRIDRGESEAIALAIELRADRLLIDETQGRAAAEELGVAVVGVAGILVEAKRKGLVPAVAPLLVQLRDQHRFRLTRGFIVAIAQSVGEEVD